MSAPRVMTVGLLFLGLSCLQLACGATSEPARGQDPLMEMARESLAQIDGAIDLPGLENPVEVIRDQWGVPHIYAQSMDDLFFAQGFVMAQDRLWQMEMWRRQRQGRLAEVLGPAAVARDRQTRMLMYRGLPDDNDAEWTSYHPEGKRIFTAYTNGVNAFMAYAGDNLPVEFKLTGIRPEPWTPETVILRAASFGGARGELQLARDVAELGLEAANRRANPDPWNDLQVPEGLDVSIIGDEVVASLGRGGGGLPRPDILPEYTALVSQTTLNMPTGEIADPGSNNWVVSGRLSATGLPVVVNDPHRQVTLPSLRYIVHLNAPGWNVIGSGEPPFVGVAIGHNERLAWGLTIVGTDTHDVFVEEVNPDNPNEVRWDGAWEPLTIVTEDIEVKGEEPRTVELKFSRHGPIFYEDAVNHRAYALRSIMNDPGTASYLGGLRLDQTENCREFLDAAMYWKFPSENLICGDVEGNISWQASALTPSRTGWLGRLPVPSSGRYEWDGFRSDLPRELNPDRGFVATANHNIQPPDYQPPLMFKRPSPFGRINRLWELITSDGTYSIDEHRRFQNDERSPQAAADVSLFDGWTAGSEEVERARAMISGWDAFMTRDSAAAALYMAWRDVVDDAARSDETPAAARPELVEAGLRGAIDQLTTEQGADWSAWRWGRTNARAFPHPVLSAFDLPTVERGGGSGTVAANGASYREIMDVSDWDRSLVTNTPGQSGQPESPFYGSLLPLWADNEYFPLAFSRDAVEEHEAHRLTLQPAR